MGRLRSFDPYREALRHDFMTFTERCFRELKPGEAFETAAYLEILADKLDACRRGEIRRLIVNISPRSLKSILGSVALPAFILGHEPRREIICASYGQTLSEALARDCRIVMKSDWYREIFGDPDLKGALNDFSTSRGGFRFATSVGGVLTGRGADVIIIDDPLKPDEALSETQRSAVNGWFDNTLMSRLNSQARGIIILIMQRLHMDDLAGHLIQKGGWEVLSFPAIATEDEKILCTTLLGPITHRRRAGEALHPARLPPGRLAEIRAEIGSFNFAAQYQQSPIPIEGNLVKRSWFGRFDPAEPPAFIGIVQSWDTANKAGELNDYSVCTTWGTVRGRHYLLDVFRRRLEFPDLKRAVAAQANHHGATTILIEDRASGTQLIQELRRDGMAGIRSVDPRPGSDKVMRLHMHTATIEEGRLVLPTQAPWLNEYETELTGFPGLRHDDQVDSTTQALTFFGEGYSLATWERIDD